MLITTLSGCIGQDRGVPLTPLKEIAGHEEYYFDSKVRTRGYVFPDHVIQVYKNDKRMVFSLNVEPNRNSTSIRIMMTITDMGSVPIPLDLYDSYIEIFGYGQHNDDIGYYIGYTKSRSATPPVQITTEPVVTITITVNTNSSDENAM